LQPTHPILAGKYQFIDYADSTAKEVRRARGTGIMTNSGVPWHKLAHNPEPIDKIYGRELSLNDAAVSKLILDWDGPRMDVTFLVRDLPEVIPVKWTRDRVNAVAIELRLIAVHGLAVNRWGTQNRVRVRWEIDDSSLKRLTLHGEEVDVVVTFELLFIASVSGYTDGRADGC
jgi:hypothetical protein